MDSHPAKPPEGTAIPPQTVRLSPQGEHRHGAHGPSSGGPIDFVLNGAPQHVVARPHETLLATLRERCGITSVKSGCSPEGRCGCCLALVNGQPRCLAVDHVVLCAGQEPLNELAPPGPVDVADPATGGPRFHVIGGASVATELDAERAIREGTELAARL